MIQALFAVSFGEIMGLEGLLYQWENFDFEGPPLCRKPIVESYGQGGERVAARVKVSRVDARRIAVMGWLGRRSVEIPRS
jgi:hypothetical protein